MTKPAICVFLSFFALSTLANPAFHEECKAFREKSDTVKTPEKIQFPHGLLWEIKHPNGKINYLFGSIHSQDRRVNGIPPEVRLALINSKHLLMEAIPSEATGKIFFEAIYHKDESSIQQELSAPMYDALRFFSKDYGIDMSRLEKIKPWAAFSLIGRPKPIRAATLELNILQLAQSQGIQVSELESVDEMINAMDTLAKNDQITILQDTLCNYKSILEDAEKLVTYYMNRDLQSIHNLTHQTHQDEALFQRFMENIVYERNRRFMKKITPLFLQGGQFVIVGASHLIGKEGMLGKLQKDGYTVTPLY